MRMISEGFACEAYDFNEINFGHADRKPWVATTATGGTIALNVTRTGYLRFSLTSAETAAAAAGGPVQYRPDRNGRLLWLEARIKTSNADQSSIFVGFSDANTDSVVIEDEDGALNTVAADAAGLLLEGQQLERFQGVSVRGSSDGPQVDFNEITIADAEWHVLRVEVNTDGDVKLAVDGFYSEWQRGP